MTTFYANQNDYFTTQQSENAARIHTIDYSVYLGSDTISSSSWSTDDSGLTIANTANTTTTTTARFSGSPGFYTVINKVVLAGGDTDERTIEVIIRDNDTPIGERAAGRLTTDYNV